MIILHLYSNQGNACKYMIMLSYIYNGCLQTVCMCGGSEGEGGKGRWGSGGVDGGVRGGGGGRGGGGVVGVDRVGGGGGGW